MHQFENTQRFVCAALALSFALPLVLGCFPPASSAMEGTATVATATIDLQSKEPESVVPVSINEKWWTSRQAKLVKIARSSHPDVVFFGDSITAFMNVELLHKIFGQ